MFSLRIVSTSHYQGEPLPDLDVQYSSFRSTDVRKVPVLRIFGATPAGQKTCMHVHGVFPYLYVPYDGTAPTDSYLRRFAASLDKAINVANNSQANTQHVFKISLVAGIPMYGYQPEEQQFLKIYLYNPSTVRKAADLLLGGAVMNKSFQPHEAHIPFPLQLFIDYNLYGMNMINVAAVKFRRKSPTPSDGKPSRKEEDSGDTSMGGMRFSPSPPFSVSTPGSSSSSSTPCMTVWDLDHIPSDLLLPANVERQSVCELEVDVVAADILNRREVTDNMGKNPGLAALWEDERQRRRDVGQPSQITPQQSQDHDQVEMSSSEQELLERFTEIVHQHQALRRSESEESEMSVEESTLSPEDITCIPASQLEDHSQPASQYADSQESLQSSQDTVVVEGEEEEEGAVISVASIQRVVSFSQSFSRPGSQPTSTPPAEGEAADQSLVEVLAALAEESSPVASQRCAAQVEALEDEDSMVGRRVALPPDSAALQQDMEETLHMSQTLPDNSYDVEGLETTWDGSPDQQKDGDVDSDETGSEEGDDDNIPQLDGASDPKPGSKKSGKKRLGVRGPVLSTLAAAFRQEGSAQGEASELLPDRDPTPPLPQPFPSLTDSQADDSQHCFKEGPHDSAFGSSGGEVPVSSSFSFCKSSLSCVSGGDVDVVTTIAPSLPYGNSSKDEDRGQHCRGDGGLLGQTEPCPQKPMSSMALATSAWCGDQHGDQTSSPAGEEAVSMGTAEVCRNEAQSCRQSDSGIDMSASSSSCQCVVRMERLDKWIHPKKLALSLNRAQQPSPDRPVISPPSLPSPLSTPYSFTYHVPIPVYKRLKTHGACSEREPEEIQCVRLHFMDAQPNLLQKLGQELVHVQPLTADDLKHAGVVLDKRVDEEEDVLENVFQEYGAEGQFSVVPFPRDDTSLSAQDRGKRGIRRPLMGPKCCRKSPGTSGRCQTSFTGPDMGERGSEQEVDKDSGGGVHIAMGVSAGSSTALLQTSSTARTCFAMEDYGKGVDCQPLVTSAQQICSSKADDGEQGKVSSHSPPHAGRSTVDGGHSSHLAQLGVRTSQPLPVTAQSSYHMSLSPLSVPSAPVSLPFSASASLPISLVSSKNKTGMIPPLSSQSCSLSPGRFGSSHSDTLHQAGPSAPCTTSSSFPSIPVTVSSSSPDLGSYRSNHMAGGVDGQSSASRQPGPTSPLPHHHNSMYSLQGQCSQDSKHTSSGSPPKHTSPQPADELSCLQHSASCYSSQTSLGSLQLVPADTAGFEKRKNAETCLKSSNHGLSCLPSQCDSHTQPDKQSENKMAVEHSENKEELKSERKCLQFLQNVNSDDDFSGKGHKACEDKTVRRKSNSSAINDVASDIDLLDELPLSALRHSSVQLWSMGDSDSDSDSMDSDESSDDYCPNSRAQRKKGKRKGNKQLNKSGSKRAKWSVVNNGVHSNSKHAAHDGEKKQSRKGQKNRGGKTKRKMKKEQLIEGVHYIVIGKFKGHRVMLVKLERVKVSPNDRVKVSDWQGRNTGNGVKTKPRLLGPRCCRLANGISASHPSLVHLPTKRPPSPDWGHHASAALEENPATAWEGPNVSAPSLNREDSSVEEVAAVKESDCVNHKGLQPMTGMPKGGDFQQGHGSLTAEHLLMHNGTVIPEKLLFSSAVMIEKLQQNKIVKTEEMPKQNKLVDVDQSQQQDGILNIEKAQQQNSVVRQQNSVNGEALQQQNSVKVEKIQQCNSVGGEELQQEGTLDTDRMEMLEAHDESGSALSADTVKNASLQLRAMVARQRKRRKGLNRVPSAPSNLQTSTGKEVDNTEQGRPVYCAESLQLQDTPVGRGQCIEEQKGKGKDQDKSLPASSVPCSFVGSEEGESSQESSTAQHPAPPAAVDLDTDSRLAASECTSHTQSPVPRMGQLSSHPPFTISEHSQDADCSSVPQSNPESTSSSPAFPRMALTHADSKDDDEPSAVLAESAAQTPSTAKKEVCEGDHRSPVPLCLQSVCKKMKEVRASQRTMEVSSDSSDSQDGVDEELAYIKHQQKSTHVLGLPWKDKLMSDEGVITADMDKDKLKKQKKLTPNQRLGVAFLSKRRRKGKLKGGSGRSEGGGGGGSSKVMDSLSLLHMATLASLGAKTDSSGDTYRCTTWRLVNSKVEEKENHNVATLQHSGGNLQWKTFSFCAGADKREGKSDGGVDEESLLTSEKGPDLGDVQAIEEDMNMGEETSTIQNMELGHPQDSKSMEAGREDKGSDDSGDETDDYDISESLESGKGEKCGGETAAKSKSMSSESSDEHAGMKSESRSDGHIQNDTTNNKSCDYKPPLYEDSDDKTDDYTVVGNLKRSSNRRPRDSRNRRVKRKARGSRNKSSKSSNKVLDSLDVLHMATLASLGTDPAPPVHDDTLPRYSDSVWDHTDDYEESLIKMAYTSPVPSDVADLSPPLPLSPEDLSKVNLKNIQKQRPMPCRLKVEESRGTRNVCMAQVRAENAAERMSRLFVPLSRHDPRGSWQANGAAKDSVLVGSSPRMKQHTVPVLSRSASESAAHAGPVKPQSVFVDRIASSQSLPSTCHSAQTSIPNRDKLFMTGQNAQQAIHNRGKLSVTCHSAQTSIPNPDKLSVTCHSAQTSIPNPDKLSITCHSAQTSIPRTDKLPTIPNPDKLPVPSIPWHHPLHVAIDCAEGRALKEEVIHNITSKKLNSRCTSLDNNSSPNLSLQFKDSFCLEDRQASVSSGTSTQSAAFLRSLPLPTRQVRDNRRIQPSSSAPLSHSGERTPRVLQSDMPVPRRVSVSGGPLGEIHNHVGSRPLPFSSLAQRYAQRDRDSERIPSVSDRVSELNEQHWGKSCGIWQTSTNSRSNAHPCRTDSNVDSFCTSPASSKLTLMGSSYQWPSQSPKEAEGGLYCSTNKPVTPFSPRGLHSMGSKTSPYGGRSFWSRSLDNREINSQGEEGSKSQREGESRCQREGELRNQREGEFRICREGELKNQREGKVRNQGEGDLRSQREGEFFRSQREGENRNERDGEIQSQQDRESRNQRDGEVRIQRDGEVRSLRDDCVFADGMTPGVDVHNQPPGTPTIRSGGPHTGNPSPVSHPHLPSSHHSPRLSRTEMVISQIFNLDSTSKTCKPWQNYAHHTSPHSIQKDRWPDSKPDMERNSGKPLCGQQGESHMLRQHSTDLVSPASVSWEQPPIGRSETFECPFPSSQPSTLQRSDDDETQPTKKWSKMASKYDSIRSSFSEMSVSQVMFRDREKSSQSPSAVFCDSSPLTGNPQSTGWYKPASSPGQSHQIRSDQMRSPPAYQDIAYSSSKSPRSCSSSALVTSKWPGYSCENQPSFLSKSSSFHSSDRGREDDKLPVSSGIEKNHYSSTSCSTNIMDRNMNGVKLAESCNKDPPGSTSPMVCSPSKTHSSMAATSKSPCRGSPRSKQWESIRPSKADEWHQQKRKRSVGEYLEEMIESAYAKGPAEERPYGWSEVPREDFGHPVKCSAESSYMQAMAANGLTSSALDLSVCSGKIDNADQSVSSGLLAQTPSISSVPVTCASSPPVHMPSSYAMTGVSSVLSTTYYTSVPMVTAFTTAVTCTSTVPPVCCAALNTSRPTWTTIKTDDFENITDDEDEEVIPSSQGYSTSVYRFPGFRRLSSISSTWTPYSVHSQQSLSTASVTGSQTGTDADSRANLSETVMSSHRYISSLYTKGLYSQCNRASESSQLNYGTKLGQTGNNKEQYRGEDRDVMMQCTQKEEQGIVSSLGTPWRETQPSVSVATSSLMSQFEPITDSEEEEEKSNMDNIHSSHTGTSHYMSSASSAAFSGSTFFPVHSLMTSSAYSALGSSVMAPTSSIVQPLLQDKPVTASPILSQKSPGYTAASNRLFSLTGNFSAEEPSSSIQCSDSLSDVHAVSSMLSEKRVLLCDEGGAEKRDDSEPEDGGGRKRKKGGGASPTDRPPSSSQRLHREKGEKEDRPENMGSGWRRSPEEQSLDPWSREKPGQVLCPRAPPPSRQTVEASAASVGLSVEPVRPTFCSHPPDLPETPRELGGRVLRLPTNTVRELEELLPSGEGRGLGAWQSLKASENPILSSQPHPSSLAQRLQAEPQLRFVLAGDGPCVITPVRPPPRCSQVTTWLQDMMQTMVPPRSQADLKGETTEEGEEAWGTSGETSMPLDIDLPGEDREEQGSQDSSDEETSIFTRLKSRPGQAGQKTQRDDASDDISHGSSTPKRQRLDSDVLHSTPVRRSSSDLFDVTCTPISRGQGGESSGQQGDTSDPQFVPPARPPLRRLSTNTQAALTKAMMTSDRRRQSLEGETSQIDAPTPRNAHGFKVTQQNLQDAKALHKHQFLTVLSMELHTDSRGDLMPDPEVDAIRVVFYAVFDDIPPEKGPRNMTGAIVVDRESCQAGGGDGCRPSTSAGTGGHGKQTLFEKCSVVEDLEVVYVPSETDLIHHLASFIVRLDPDILLGFEVQQMSWGFLLQRAAHLSINLCSKIARIHGPKQGSRFSAEKDEWGADHTSEIHIEGRIVLNLWRLLRHEVTLNIYSFENCAFHILHRRVPAFTYRTLTFWYDHRTHLHAWRVVDHYMQRVKGQLAMLDQLDLIGKTSEFARVFGIEFFDVLSRGSQYRVESMMLRLAKPLNFIPVSPSVQQRARQKAPECIPLTLEPQSQMYTDPVVVLDFQSLYPSIMIAYNYCFSTCLGRLEHLAQANEGPIEFGCTSLNIAPETLKKVRKHVTISPNGCVFVTGKVRKGVLPMMVEEILKTRLMVKKSMKDYKDDKTLHRLLDARQLGLKLIANVTYGYTGASFSGRMPCIEVGDSIVRKARESLERAIQLVEDTAHWRAQVVYGDTDSLFIRLPGRSKDEAFVLGQEMADAVTNMFPKPMKLKFEKVYLPCVLQTKKRYVGFMYESADQQEAVFDAKGIETVRRDNCGVVSKVLERCIKILFTQRDVSLVRAYLHRQLTKMLAGRVGLQDYVFAKEYRGMMGYKPGACVPALEIARKRLRVDRRGEPRVGERVPYVIVHGSPGLPLIQLVRQPRELLRDPSLRINVTYYITKQVLPPLDRMLSLVGVSVFQWYSDMPKVVRLAPHVAPDTQRTRQGTISQYFVTSDCLVCEGQTKEAVCVSCRQDPQLVALTLASRSANYERQQNRLAKVCHTCMGVQDSTQPCVSLDCPVLFRRHLATIDLARADLHREALLKLTTF